MAICTMDTLICKICVFQGVHHGTDTSFFLTIVSNPWGNKKENIDFAMDIIKVFTNFVNEG